MGKHARVDYSRARGIAEIAIFWKYTLEDFPYAEHLAEVQSRIPIGSLKRDSYGFHCWLR